MKDPTLPAILAMAWMLAVSLAIFYLTWEKTHLREPDLSVCPLCDRSVSPSSTWKLHPGTP